MYNNLTILYGFIVATFCYFCIAKYCYTIPLSYFYANYIKMFQ